MADLILKPTTGSGNKIIIQDQGGTAFLTSADSGSVLGDNAYQSNKYWAHGKMNAATSITSASFVYASFDGTGATTNVFHIDWATGSDANTTTSASGNNFHQGDASDRLKIVQAGVYLVVFNANFSAAGHAYETFFFASIQDGSNSVLAESSDQVSTDSSSTEFGNANATLIKHFTANSEIKLGTRITNGCIMEPWTHFSICLIRPTA